MKWKQKRLLFFFVEFYEKQTLMRENENCNDCQHLFLSYIHKNIVQTAYFLILDIKLGYAVERTTLHSIFPQRQCKIYFFKCCSLFPFKQLSLRVYNIKKREFNDKS